MTSYGGAIYAIGGLTDNACYNTVERYDVGRNHWTSVATLIIPRGGVATVTLDVSTLKYLIFWILRISDKEFILIVVV